MLNGRAGGCAVVSAGEGRGGRSGGREEDLGAVT